MTVQLDIEIVQGQRWVQLFEVSGLTSDGFGQRLHIRDHHGATLLRAALTHDGATNARVSLTTGGILANLGATVSTAWDLQGHAVRRWVYSVEHYSLSDAENVTVTHAGTAIIKANPTDESSITPVAPWPSYDLVAVRYDLEQTLTEPQKARARANIGVGDEGALVEWGGIGGTLTDQTDLVSALAGKETAGAVTTHANAADPHPGYLQNLAIHGTADVIVTVSTNGEVLSRSSYTTATLITAAAAAAPVQSVAGRTGAVVIAVADVSGAESTANKAVANGYASLDSGGKVPQAQLPAIAITEYLGDVASQAAMLALSGQKGDWCTRSDSPGTWIITGTDPTLLGSWTQIVHPTDAVTSVAGRTGAVTISATDITDSTATGRSIVTAADAAAVRTAAALGNSATLNVGTTAGTVAAGDDARLSDARTPTAHNHAASEITSGTLDAARLPTPTTTTLGGVKRNTGSAGQYVTGIDTDGSLLLDTPAGGSPAGAGTELQYRNGSAFGAMSGTAWDDTNRSLALTGATVTASAPILDLSQTWNNAAVAFTAERTNVTNTASAATSLLRDWQVGGVSKVRFGKGGDIVSAAGGIRAIADSVSTDVFQGYWGPSLPVFRVRINAGVPQVTVDANGSYSFNSTIFSLATPDVILYRDAAGVLAQRNATNAQVFRVYGTFTDASNYVRGALSSSSTAVTLAAETAGTGADNVPVVISPGGTAQVEVGNGVQFTEMTAPSAPAANKVILFAQDNGAGKTQLMALFPSGAAQQVAIEP